MSGSAFIQPEWLIELPTCPSTNSWALERLSEFADGSCVWTRRQTAGRGQGSRRWFAPTGVLTASFIVPAPSQVPVTYLSLCVGLVIAHAVEDHAPAARVQVKWPNDCYVAGRKLAGVLCERPAAGATDRVVIGIGLNLDPRWEDSPETLLFATDRAQMPASVAELCDPPPDPVAVLVSLRRYLLESVGMLTAGGWMQLVTHLRRRDFLLGRPVRIESLDEQFAGIAQGIDDRGHLLVRLADGSIRPVASAASLTVG